MDGSPPDAEPDSEPGTVQLTADRGENSVYIAGAKCWRRYRVGGWLTRRDAFDCNSLKEFQEFHWIGGEPIHAFNVSHPGGVDLDPESSQSRRETLHSLHALRDDVRGHAEATEVVPEAATTLLNRARSIPVWLPVSVIESTGDTPMETVQTLAEILDKTLSDQKRPNRNCEVAQMQLCERYYS